LAGVKSFYEGCLKIEVLESVDVVNGFEGSLEGLCISVREASVEDGEGAFDTRPPLPLFYVLFYAFLFALLVSAFFADFNKKARSLSHCAFFQSGRCVGARETPSAGQARAPFYVRGG